MRLGAGGSRRSILTEAQMTSDERHDGGFRAVFTRPALVLLVALLFGETTINFIDRQVVSVLAPTSARRVPHEQQPVRAIVNVFMATYAVSYAFAGWVIDRLGVGRGLTLSVIWWSSAGMLTALARGPLSLGAFRSVLAVGEGGAWPAFAKAVAAVGAPEARTLAIGVCNSGSSLGAMIAPPMVVVDHRHRWMARRPSWPPAPSASCGCWHFSSFATLHPEMARAERARNWPPTRSFLGRIAALPPDMGGLRLPLFGRPAMVFLRLLDPRIPGARARPEPGRASAPWPGFPSWSPICPTSPAATSRCASSAPAGA